MSRKYLLALVASLLLLDLGMQPRAVYADPAQVYVCWSPCQEPNIIGPVSFEGNYVPQVLANEWPGAARSQALYAGAMAIRTFSQRAADGCGAIGTYKNGIPVENNVSQHYWYGNDPTTGQAPIQQRHFAAVNATAGKEIIRASDGQLACAKYFANVGNPTAQGGELPTLASIPDPVYSGGAGTVPGMGQNGTYAWTLNTAGQQTTRWTWQHILSHYYTNVAFSGGTNSTFVPEANSQYRWAWLNRGNTIVYNGSFGATYYSPIGNTPATMSPGGAYYVAFWLHNTSTRTWESDGISSNPDRLGYRWLNLNGTPASGWADYRTPLPSPGWVAPGGNISLRAWVGAPSTPGAYILEWDMVREGITWFRWQGGDRPATQSVLVAVGTVKGAAFYTDINYGSSVVYLTASHPDFPSLGINDAVTSVLISPGCTVTLYEHWYYGGASLSLTGSVPDLRDYLVGSGTWNDFASSTNISCQ